jgi:hypothetical protein
VALKPGPLFFYPGERTLQSSIKALDERDGVWRDLGLGNRGDFILFPGWSIWTLGSLREELMVCMREQERGGV